MSRSCQACTRGRGIIAFCIHAMGSGSYGERFWSEPWALIHEANLHAFHQGLTQHGF